MADKMSENNKVHEQDNRESFVWEHMDFEIARTSWNCMIIMKGKMDKIIIWNLPENMNIEGAHAALTGFFDGIKYAQGNARKAPDLKRAYYVGEGK